MVPACPKCRWLDGRQPQCSDAETPEFARSKLGARSLGHPPAKGGNAERCPAPAGGGALGGTTQSRLGPQCPATIEERGSRGTATYPRTQALGLEPGPYPGWPRAVGRSLPGGRACWGHPGLRTLGPICPYPSELSRWWGPICQPVSWAWARRAPHIGRIDPRPHLRACSPQWPNVLPASAEKVKPREVIPSALLPPRGSQAFGGNSGAGLSVTPPLDAPPRPGKVVAWALLGT